MGSVVSHCEEEQQEEAPAEQTQEESPETTDQADSGDSGADGGDEGGGDSEEGGDEEEEHKPEVHVETVPYDFRFPGVNQARNCYTRYNEYYKCTSNKSEDDPDCKRHARAYRAICPGEWVERWNEARENGSWFGKY